MRSILGRVLTCACVACLSLAAVPASSQAQEEERDWQDILKNVVQEAVEDGTSSTRLGRIRHIDVVSRSGSMVELEVELRDITEPDRTMLSVDVFDENYDTVRGFVTEHDPIPQGDSTVLVRLTYTGGPDVRSVGVKVNLVDAETDAVATRRKAALPWEWSGDGSSSYASARGAMADPDGLSTRGGWDTPAETREPRIVDLEPRRMPGTPAMEEIHVGVLATAVKQQPQQAQPGQHSPPPPSASTSSSKDRTANTATLHATSAAIASGKVVMATSLDLYAMAKAATWSSRAGTLPYNGSTKDKRGSVRPLGSNELINGRSYDKVLWTHPEWKDDGYIRGSYELTIPPSAKTFEAKVGFLPNVKNSDGVQFSVLIRHGPRSYNLIRKTVRPADGVVSVREAIPESVRGQRVKVELWTKTGGTSTQDWFAWSSPTIK